MKLLASSSATLRSLDVYNPLQIYLEATNSLEVDFFMVQSTIGPVSSMDDLPRHAAYVVFKVLLITATDHGN